jgi:hypothetical protein
MNFDEWLKLEEQKDLAAMCFGNPALYKIFYRIYTADKTPVVRDWQ